MRRRLLLTKTVQKKVLEVKPTEAIWIDVGNPGTWQVTANVPWIVR